MPIIRKRGRVSAIRRSVLSDRYARPKSRWMEGGERLRDIWNQGRIPVILRRGEKGEKLRVRLPYAQDNREWLQNEKRTAPTWVGGERYWETPKGWFNDLVRRSLIRYERLYIIQPFREQEKCAPACMNAIGHECECSCMGANHGAGNDGSWFEVSETFATRWSGRHLACQLMIRAQTLTDGRG